MGKIRIPQKLREALQRRYNRQPERVRAVLGKSDGTIAGDKTNFVWVTDANDDETQVFNDVIPANRYGYGLPVWIERIENSNLWRLAAIRQIYGSAPVAVGIKEHANTHTAYGNDPVWVWSDQIMPWLVVPVGLTLKVYRMAYHSTVWEDAAIETLSLVANVPATGALYVLVEVDTNGDLIVTEGTPATSKNVLVVTDIPAPTTSRQSLCAVRLYAGQTVIAKNGVNKDIYDLRFAWVFGSGGGGGGGTPGGADTQVQYNDGGAFAGDANLVWNKSTKIMTLESLLDIDKHGFYSYHTGNPFCIFGDYSLQYGFYDAGGAQIEFGTGAAIAGLKLRSAADYFAVLDTSALTANREFDFPNAAGTLALGANADTLEPTGWVDQNAVAAAMTYDSSTRKISIGGTHSYYWRGVKTSVTDFVSSAHTDTVGHQYYLSSSDGTTFTWATDSPWLFSDLQVAFINYQTSNKWAIAESHGLMPYQDHEEFHSRIGTYKESGGTLDPATYTLLSTTAANRRPDVLATHLHDEDIDLTLAALTSKTYNKFSLSGASTINFSGATADIVALLTNNPYYNSFSTPNWGQTLMANNSYMCVWLFAAPVTGDAGSQAYRYFWLQGQSNTNLAGQVSATPADLNFGTLETEATEFVALVKIIIRYTGGNWDLYSVTNISGSKFSQTGTAAGTFLSSVATDGSVAGDGHTTNPLSTASLETTATAAGTTTLLVSSATRQEFTGTTTQTIVLPVVTTLRIGRKFEIDNNSTGVLTVNSSGGNLVQSMAAGSTAIITCILITGTGAASWDVVYLPGGIAPLASPTFTGVPTAPTAAALTNTTQLATTAFVQQEAGAGWIPAAGTWTYSSADAPTFVISINADVTGIISVGMRIKLTQTTVKYFIVTAVGAFGSGVTLVTVYGGTDYTLANAAISSPFISPVKVPFGFPIAPLKWTVTVTDTNNQTQLSAGNGTYYYAGIGSINISVPIGAWRLTWQALICAGGATNTYVNIFAALSTANNSFSDNRLVAFAGFDGASQALSTYVTAYKQITLLATSKTPYYFVAKTTSNMSPAIIIYGGLSTTVLTAECAYL
jgi:hypothetical protein